MSRENLVEFFRDYFASDREYLIYDDGYRWWRYTRRQIFGGAAAFAARLRQAGVGKNDRVLIWSESRPEWIMAFWGTLIAGAIVVPIGSESSFEFSRKVQEIVQAKIVVVGADVSWNADTPIWRLTGESWTQGSARFSVPETRAGDLAEIVFTSGSTGYPKGVEITHGNLLSEVEAVEPDTRVYRQYLARAASIRFLQLLPLSHLFGQVATLGLPPLLNASAVITRRQSPSALVKLIRRQRIMAAVCVPRILDALRSQIIAWFPETARAGEDCTSFWERLWRYRRIHQMFGWRFLGVVPGGAPLDPSLERFWRGLGFLVVQGYGLTETSPVIALNHPWHRREGSVGRPLPGVEVRIAEDGEILVHGPNVTPGYYRQPEQTAEVLRNGWFRTGDLGYIDREGYLYIRGRKKEMIVTAEGLNVFPEDVERVLDALPGVRESAVFGLAARGDGAGEQVFAAVIAEPGVDVDGIAVDANQRLEPHQRIRGVSAWPEAALPRTPNTGKVRRTAIRERIAAQLTGQPVSGSDGVVNEGSADIIVEEVERRTGRRVSSGMRLDDLGLGSIDRVELLLEMERISKREIDEAEIAACQTVGELHEAMERALRNHEAPRSLSVRGRSEFPAWNRNRISRFVRNANLALWILPATNLFAKPVVSGVDKLNGLEGPVLFAANHQSHLDTPLIFGALPARWRYRVAPAMYKEYFSAHFKPDEYPPLQRLSMSLQYYAVALLFNAFPIPQAEAGVAEVLRYAGDLVSEGWSLLIYPEGERRQSRQMGEFQPGTGLIASRLHLPVVPVHLEGVDHVLPRERVIPRFGATSVTFGDPIWPNGEDPGTFVHELEETVHAL